MLIAVPLVTAIANWDSLPVRIATRFSTDGTPQEWMSRAAAVTSLLGSMAILVVVAALLLAGRTPPLTTRMVVGIEYFFLAFISVVATDLLLSQSRSGPTGPSLAVVLAGCLVGAIVAAVVVVVAQGGRRTSDPSGN